MAGGKGGNLLGQRKESNNNPPVDQGSETIPGTGGNNQGSETIPGIGENGQGRQIQDSDASNPGGNRPSVSPVQGHLNPDEEERETKNVEGGTWTKLGLDEINEAALELAAGNESILYANNQLGENDTFDKPDEVPEDAEDFEPMPINMHMSAENGLRLAELAESVHLCRTSNIYKAVCVARVLNFGGKNPLSDASRAKSVGKGVEFAWDTLMDINSSIAGSNKIAGAVMGKDAENVTDPISAITNAVSAVSAAVNAIRKTVKYIQNFKNKNKKYMGGWENVADLIEILKLPIAKMGLHLDKSIL